MPDSKEKKDTTEEVTTEQIMEAVKGFQENLEKYGEESVDFKEFEAKTIELFETQEKQNQKLIAENAEKEKKALEMEERMETLEKEIVEQTQTKNINYKETPEYKALQIFCQEGVTALDLDQKQLLRTDNATQGGYLTMPEMDSMILKQITEVSPIRSLARVKSTGSKTLEIPVRTGIPQAAYEGEAAEDVLDTSDYGLETVTAYRLSVTVPFTRDMMMDSEFNLENEITGDVAESFAQAEGRGFVLGTGAKQPEGFLSLAAGLQADARETATASTITGDDLILLTGDLKVGYQPYYGFSRQSLARFRTFKGAVDGQYLWQTGLGGGAPNTLAGYPYILIEDMPDYDGTSGGNGTFPVVFADFMRGYTIIDRTGLEIIRDEVTRKRQAVIELTFHRWNTGQVVLPEAFKLLEIKS